MTTVLTGGGTSDKPELSQMQWNLLALPAIVLLVMAVLQIISFGDFKDWLTSAGVGAPAAVAVIVVIAELWGALSLLQVRIGRIWRWIGLTLAVLASGFWFIENVTQATNARLTTATTNSGFFGHYLQQTVGWWTVIEISLLLFLVIWAAEMLHWRSNR